MLACAFKRHTSRRKKVSENVFQEGGEGNENRARLWRYLGIDLHRPLPSLDALTRRYVAVSLEYRVANVTSSVGVVGRKHQGSLEFLVQGARVEASKVASCSVESPRPSVSISLSFLLELPIQSPPSS